MEYTKIGQNIRRKRRAQDIAQEQLAEIIHVSTSFVGHIERGTRKMSLDTFRAICKALNTSSDELLDL